MKVLVAQSVLAAGIAAVIGGVARRTALPVLEHILLEAAEDRLTLKATDLDVAVTAAVGATVETPGCVTVPGKMFQAVIAARSSASVITLAANGCQVSVTTDGYRGLLRGLDADQFPMLPSEGQQPAGIVDAATLRDALGQVAQAVASDEYRPVLSGVQFAFRGDTLALAGADGFRLASRTLPAVRDGEDRVFIVPRASVKLLTSLLQRRCGEVAVSIGVGPNPAARFCFDGATVYSRTIEGAFPDVRQIIPTEHTTRLTVPTKEFREANKLALAVARDANMIVRYASEADGFSVGAINDRAESFTDVEAVSEGEQLTVVFNGGFIDQALRGIKDEQVTVSLGKPSDPGAIRPVGRDDLVYVIMPMQLGERKR